jgi:hypothetical protein
MSDHIGRRHQPEPDDGCQSWRAAEFFLDEALEIGAEAVTKGCRISPKQEPECRRDEAIAQTAWRHGLPRSSGADDYGSPGRRAAS